MIERYLLRYFLAVIDSGTFTAAAAQMAVSQPTLSAGIAKLEREVGAKLLRRSSQRIELTEAGSQFAVHARRIEREFNLAAATVGGIAQPATLRLGVAARGLAMRCARCWRSAPLRGGAMEGAARARARRPDPSRELEYTAQLF